ncbi:MAG: dephospho-CoA kinase [Planctomycetota bacterium]
MTLVVGILGPPCSGKSTLAKSLQSYGGVWIDADSIAKEQLDEPEVSDALIEMFGDQILDERRQLNRSAIASLVFGDDPSSQRRLRQLESVIHPRVRRIIHERLRDLIRAQQRWAILDVPLLIESGWSLVCDEILCVRVAKEIHMQLIANRGWTIDELVRRQQRQIADTLKQRHATRIIDNSGDPAGWREQIESWWLAIEMQSGNHDPDPQHCR